MDEAAPGRLVGEPEDRTLLEGHEVGKGVHVTLIHRDHARVAAHAIVANTRSPRPTSVTPAPIPRTIPDLAAGTERQLGLVLILALDDQDVGEVAADRADFDDDLTRVRSRSGRVRVLERRRIAPRARQHHFHRILAVGGRRFTPEPAES